MTDAPFGGCGCRKPVCDEERGSSTILTPEMASGRPPLLAPGMRVAKQRALAPTLLLHPRITPRLARIDDAARRPRAVQPPCRVPVLAQAWVPGHRQPVRGGSAPGCTTRSRQPGPGED